MGISLILMFLFFFFAVHWEGISADSSNKFNFIAKGYLYGFCKRILLTVGIFHRERRD